MVELLRCVMSSLFSLDIRAVALSQPQSFSDGRKCSLDRLNRFVLLFSKLCDPASLMQTPVQELGTLQFVLLPPIVSKHKELVSHCSAKRKTNVGGFVFSLLTPVPEFTAPLPNLIRTPVLEQSGRLTSDL